MNEFISIILLLVLSPAPEAPKPAGSQPSNP